MRGCPSLPYAARYAARSRHRHHARAFLRADTAQGHRAQYPCVVTLRRGGFGGIVGAHLERTNDSAAGIGRGPVPRTRRRLRQRHGLRAVRGRDRRRTAADLRLLRRLRSASCKQELARSISRLLPRPQPAQLPAARLRNAHPAARLPVWALCRGEVTQRPSEAMRRAQWPAPRLAALHLSRSLLRARCGARCA
jgi:hypothetical protein